MTLEIRVNEIIQVNDYVTEITDFIKKVIQKVFFKEEDDTETEEKVDNVESRAPPALGIKVEERVGTKDSFGNS